MIPHVVQNRPEQPQRLFRLDVNQSSGKFVYPLVGRVNSMINYFLRPCAVMIILLSGD
jgi:hypothetical protein